LLNCESLLDFETIAPLIHWSGVSRGWDSIK
jgi:hypothetical protein